MASRQHITIRQADKATGSAVTTKQAPPGRDDWRQALLRRHQLGAGYLDTAQTWFDPLAAGLAAHQKRAARPLLIGINGCQGSGKTTLVDYLGQVLAHVYGLRSASLSLDDCYLTHAERQALARGVHPLLATRGVPGTHDMTLLRSTLRALLRPEGGTVALPRFDKSRDDRCPPAAWPDVERPLDIVMLEGWCLGVEAQPVASLAVPCNALERDEDPDGRWRHYVNEALAREFPAVYAMVDQWLMLAAPSFACVQRWRQEQEDKLRARLGPDALERTMDAAGVARFVQHYQRLTEVCLETLPTRMDYLLRLDAQRHIVEGRYADAP
jgi:D-glycerate 3-kinase